MDVCVEGDLIGRLVMELESSLCPRASENFLRLCTGEGRVGEGETADEKRLSYVNSLIHRIVPGGWIQGGGRYTHPHTHLPLTALVTVVRYIWRQWQWRSVCLWDSI